MKWTRKQMIDKRSKPSRRTRIVELEQLRVRIAGVKARLDIPRTKDESARLAEDVLEIESRIAALRRPTLRVITGGRR
jgi:hypothetical protein